MALLDPTDLTFNGEEAREIGDAVIESAFENPVVEDTCTVFDNIVAKKQIPFLGRLSKITKKDAGCGTGITAKNIPMSEKFWDPEPVKIWLQICADELEDSFWMYMQNTGLDRDNITGTEIMKFVVQRMTEAAQEDLLRIIWFNAKDHDEFSEGGVLTNGTDISDYTIIDGIWEQIFAIVALVPARRVAIAENALATEALQLALGATTARTTFQKLITSSDPRLKGAKGKFILCTMSLLENYVAWLESQAAEASFLRVEEGYTSVRFRNTEVIAIDFWDRTIAEDFDNGTVLDLPHRALLTVKENLAVGYDKSSDVGAFKIWYSDDTEKNNMKGKYRVDAKVLQNHLIQVAY